MKKCVKPELTIIPISNNDVLRTSGCVNHTVCGDVSDECPEFVCTSVSCNLQGCPEDECPDFDWHF